MCSMTAAKLSEQEDYFVSWFEPEHLIVPAVTPFFRRTLQQYVLVDSNTRPLCPLGSQANQLYKRHHSTTESGG